VWGKIQGLVLSSPLKVFFHISCVTISKSNSSHYSRSNIERTKQLLGRVCLLLPSNLQIFEGLYDTLQVRKVKWVYFVKVYQYLYLNHFSIRHYSQKIKIFSAF